MLTTQAQQTVLAISNYLISLLSITGNAYCKTFKLKAYNDTLKKTLSSILDHGKVEFFILPCFEQLGSITHIIKWDPISSHGP